LGRATYESSTNNIWPWSFDTCDRKLQDAQAISACNRQNHFGMNPFQGRGATEIDIVEVMTGYSSKPLPATHPPLNFPYGDMTLQVRLFLLPVDCIAPCIESCTHDVASNYRSLLALSRIDHRRARRLFARASFLLLVTRSSWHRLGIKALRCKGR
jgi:hypothetical protein